MGKYKRYDTGKVSVEEKLLNLALKAVKKALNESMTPKYMATAIINEIYNELTHIKLTS